MNIQSLSSAKLEALYAKRQAASSVVTDKLIAADRGHELAWDTIAKGKANVDPLSVEAVKVWGACSEVSDEMRARREYHGSLKPIKRTVY